MGSRWVGVASVIGALVASGVLLVALQQLRDNGGDTQRNRSQSRTPTPTSTLGAVPPGGRTWFVAADAPGGGDGSSGKPFSTIQPAVDLATPGDTVRVGPGTYPGGFHSARPGTSGAIIRFSGYGARIVAVHGSTRLIEITHDHIELSGFTISGGTAGIRLYGAHHVRLVNNRVSGALGECVRVKHQSTDNEVAYNDIRDCGRRNFNLDEDRKNGEGIYVGTAPEQLAEATGGAPDRSDRNWIHDNDISTPAECVDVKESSTYVVVEHNTCSGGLDPDGAGFSARGNHVTFRGNTVVGEAGAGIRAGGDREGDGIGTNIVDNVVQSPKGYGLKLMRMPQGAICGNAIRRAGRGVSNVTLTGPARSCQ